MINEKDNKNCYLKTAPTFNGSIRTDLPLTVIGRIQKKQVTQRMTVGKLLCVGKVYIKTRKGLVRIK